MPHLAPLNWIFLPLLFYFSLLSIMSIFWWSQLPVFPILYLNPSMKSSLWNW
uniref:ATP synthase F0 subunit 8 n=1 Tax=Oligobrachia dogieli TaxID=3095170 RepID=UPI002E762E12|nr:ATP synthase F0 subunit 8 [Oligobrachia dogieli]WPV72839.1 ATP synthase F0 subunit 8 [Oligobrachia dogieli]